MQGFLKLPASMHRDTPGIVTVGAHEDRTPELNILLSCLSQLPTAMSTSHGLVRCRMVMMAQQSCLPVR